MRGIDVVDEEMQEYTMQVELHKLWQKLIMFILHISLISVYILYTCAMQPVLDYQYNHIFCAIINLYKLLLVAPSVRVGHLAN